MIEAEYKARLGDVAGLLKLLESRAEPERVLYRDVYFDDAEGALAVGDREFRLRTIVGADGETRHLLTFKDAAVDLGTGSKPEYETVVGHRGSMEQIIERLGYRPAIAFTKQCINFRYAVGRREIVVTVVTVPEIDGIFLEIETMVEDEADLGDALADLRAELKDLGVSGDQLTSELYTEAVAESRRAGS